RYTGGTCADCHDGIDPSVRRRIADDEGVTVVVRQLIGGRESLTHSSPDRSKELLILRIKLVDVGPELSLGRKFLCIGVHCHRIVPVVLSSSASNPPNDHAQQPAHAGGPSKHEEPSVAWPVCWSRLFGVVYLVCPRCPLSSSHPLHPW